MLNCRACNNAHWNFLLYSHSANGRKNYVRRAHSHECIFIPISIAIRPPYVQVFDSTIVAISFYYMTENTFQNDNCILYHYFMFAYPILFRYTRRKFSTFDLQMTLAVFAMGCCLTKMHVNST